VKPVSFHPDALVEMVEAARYYEGIQPALGHRYLDAVGAAVRRVRLQPSIYSVVADDFRQCKVERFPFVVASGSWAGALGLRPADHRTCEHD
jgi:hypothetical protein